ncbi:hypothetical protein HNR34_002467 [Geobacillus subterraneus]
MFFLYNSPTHTGVKRPKDVKILRTVPAQAEAMLAPGKLPSTPRHLKSSPCDLLSNRG